MPNEVFVDEGKRGDYLLCAAVVATSDVSEARRAMRALKPANRRRLHMHSEGAARRRSILSQFVGQPPISAAFLWQTPIQGRPEREVRDTCFRSLVAHVAKLDTRRIVVESCSQDRQDERVIGDTLARVGAIRRIDYAVVSAARDELLWAADVICWAYSAGGEYRRLIAPLVTVYNLP